MPENLSTRHTVWTVFTPRGKRLVLTDGACGWSRRADAMNAAEGFNNDTAWTMLHEKGWRLYQLVFVQAVP